MYDQWMYGPNTEIYKNNTGLKEMKLVTTDLSWQTLEEIPSDINTEEIIFKIIEF